MRTALAILVLLVLAIALGAAFFLRGGRRADILEVPRLTSIDRSDAREQAGALATEPSTASPRESATTASSSDPPSAESPAPAADSSLIVRAVSKSDGSPLARIAVHVSRKVGGEPSLRIGGAAGSLENAPLSGEDGYVSFALPSGVDLRLWACSVDDTTGATAVEVPALQAGERREITITLRTGLDLRYLARVVAAEGGEPISGARVRVVRSERRFTSNAQASNDGRLWVDEPISDTDTGTDGLVELLLSSWNPAHVRVEADGFGPALLRPAPGHETPDTALLVPLLRGASLDARVLDATGAPLLGAEVWVSTSGYELHRTREPGGDWIDLHDQTWIGRVGPDGRTVLRDLPPEALLSLEIRRAEETLRREPDELSLRPGETAEREWRIGGGCTLVGSVLDQLGEHVPSLELWLMEAYSEEPRYFEDYESDNVVARAVTDDAGRYRFPDVPAGTWSLGPAPFESLDESTSKEDAVAPVAVAVDVAGSGSKEITLRVFRGLLIRGKVLDWRGEPAGWANVESLTEDGAWAPAADCEEDGSFTLGPLVPGRYRLDAHQSRNAPSGEVTAECGERDVVLRLRRAGLLRGRVVDEATGAPCRAEVFVMPEAAGSGHSGYGVQVSSGDDGSFMRDSLEPGRYGVSARTEDGRIGVVAGVDVAPEGGDEIRVAVSGGGRLVIRYEGRQAEVLADIRASGVPVDWATTLGRGETVKMLVPAGPVVLDVRTLSGERHIVRTVSIVPGEEKEVVLSEDD